MFVKDGLTVDRTWETPDGFLGFSARFARTGIQHYLGSQIDPEGSHVNDAGERLFKPDQLYPVQRDAAEVFAPRAMGSFIAKPITNDHPSEGVNVGNWGKLAKGAIGEVLRDGEYARMSGLITDAATIADYRAGKRELSGGYQTQIIIGDGINEKGEPFVAKQSAIDGNHVALVQRGRAGSECAIRDSVAACDANPAAVRGFTTPQEPSTMKIKIGDAEVDATNGEAVRIAVDGLNAKLVDATTRATTAETNLATSATTVAAKDAEIATLKKQVEDAALTPAKLRDAAKAYAGVCGKAKALGVTFAEDADSEAIMKAVVDAKMGDAAKSWTADQIAASFAVLTKDAKVSDAPTFDTSAFRGGLHSVGDAAAKEQQAFAAANDFNAWRKQA